MPTPTPYDPLIAAQTHLSTFALDFLTVACGLTVLTLAVILFLMWKWRLSHPDYKG